MPKSYRAFTATRFPQRDSYVIPAQQSFLDIEIPDTSIANVDLPVPKEFISYFVHHEMIVEQVGRAKSVTFTHFAAPFEFYMHLRIADNLLLVQTIKRVCSSLIQDLVQTGDFEIQHYVVNFDLLRPYVTNVKGAWFKFKEPALRASAHFGNHVDKSQAFQESLQTGEISSLYVLHDFNSEQLQVQITSDCGVVIYPRIDELNTEISIVLSVLGMLEAVGAVGIIPTKQSKTGKPSLLDEGKKTKSLGPLFEILEENEQ